MNDRIILMLANASQLCAFAQIPLTNGDFEAATLIQYNNPFEVKSAEALPGWTVAFRGFPTPVPYINYNELALDSAIISIHDSQSRYFTPLEGSYSLFLQGGNVANSPGASLSQSTAVPADARSIRFLGNPDNHLELSFNGQNLPFVGLGTAGSGMLYGADISGFAGVSGDIQFHAAPLIGGGLVDNVFFSSVAIPEPSELSLMGFSFLGLIAGSFCKKSCKKVR